MLWRCWLGDSRQEEHPACKNRVMMWLSVWNEIASVWSSWCHCHLETPSSLASFKSRLVLPFCYQLTQAVLEKWPLNGCSSSSSSPYVVIVSCFWWQRWFCLSLWQMLLSSAKPLHSAGEPPSVRYAYGITDLIVQMNVNLRDRSRFAYYFSVRYPFTAAGNIFAKTWGGDLTAVVYTVLPLLYYWPHVTSRCV